MSLSNLTLIVYIYYLMIITQESLMLVQRNVLLVDLPICRSDLSRHIVCGLNAVGSGEDAVGSDRMVVRRRLP